jgi:all-trans-retinol 13,14-reductase
MSKSYSAERYDAVIVGSGLGGLVCGVILAKEGKKVCILERNKQIGGTLQTFVRNRIIFDSGVHYVGGLDKGQNLYQLFQYLGIMDKLKLKKMDEDCFDAIVFKGDPTIYKYAQGYPQFIESLVNQFPEEREAIQKYCDGIREICSKFPLYNLRSGDYFEKVGVLEIDTQTFIESLTKNKRLQNVLAGTSMLYAGAPYKTPLYVHALVVNSYIESAWRFLDGGSQIARLLTREITRRGGVVLKRQEVVSLEEENGKIAYAETKEGVRYFGDLFISNVHPVQTLSMVKADLIKKVYRNRIESLENSISTFYVNVIMKKDSFKYLNHNYYHFVEDDAWCLLNYDDQSWPKGYAMFLSAARNNESYAEAVTLMTYMRYDEVKQWHETFNTVTEEGNRGEDYEHFKKEKAEKLFDVVEDKFPGFKDAIQSYYAATPLTLRDYTGTSDGSLYGIAKDYREPMKTFVSPRTKIPNLYLTGQNLNLHGVLGVTVSAVLTCSEIVGLKYLLENIRNA